MTRHPLLQSSAFRLTLLLVSLLLTATSSPLLAGEGTDKPARTFTVVPGGVGVAAPSSGEMAEAPFIVGADSKNSAATANLKKGKENEWVIAPLPSRNPTFGWTLGVPVCRLYRPTGVADDAPAWVTGVGGFYAENESWGIGAFHKMNLSNDRWRMLGSVLYTDLRYDYYGIGMSGDAGALPLRQTASGAMVEALREVSGNLYAGLRIGKVDTMIKADQWLDSIPPELIPPDLGVDFSILAVVPRLVYDTRNNEYYPTAGDLVDVSIQVSSESMGSDLDYTRYEFSWNHYLGLGTKGSLALRVACKYASEDAPFFLYPAFGQSGDLRGYTPGTYRNQLLVATQAEYRYRVRKNLGIVAFAGVGGVAPTPSELELKLPSAGVGLRYVLAQENNVSLRVDFAWGRDENQFYVGIGEAF
jgi:hypothetical protein